MKSRRYLNVGPLHKARAGEFFDRTVKDYFTEHELGGPQPEAVAEPSPIILFPGPIQSTHAE